MSWCLYTLCALLKHSDHDYNVVVDTWIFREYVSMSEHEKNVMSDPVSAGNIFHSDSSFFSKEAEPISGDITTETAHLTSDNRVVGSEDLHQIECLPSPIVTF